MKAITTLLLAVLFPGIIVAEMHCANPSVNAGIVYAGIRLKQRFTFVNRGTAPIQILEARGSCGCLNPRLSRRILEPAEEGSMELEINTLSQPAGPNSWTVHLRYRESGTVRELMLQLGAHLVSEVMVEPAAMVLLADKAAGHAVTITDTRSKAFLVREVRSSSDKLAAHILGPENDKDGHRTFKIAFDVAADYPEGRHDEILDIYTDDPRYAELRVPVTIVKQSQKRFAAMPGEVNLTAAAGQPVPSRIVLIRDAQGQRVKVGAITTDDPAITCRWAEGPNTMATLKIQVARAKVQGNTISSAVHVHLAHPAQETLTIPVNCVLH